MRPTHVFLAVLVVAIWGFNFVVIKIGLQDFPPLLLATLRFFLSCFPAVFFFKKPDIRLHYLLGYGFVLGVLQFGLLFCGIYAGMSAGLASVVIQLQVFFTIALGVFLLKERLNSNQLFGMLIAFCGIGLIATISDQTTNLFALLLVVASAASWGLANVIVKKAGKVNGLALIVWSSLVSPIPLLGLSLYVEGYDRVLHALTNLQWISIAAVLYIAYPTTVFGWALWNKLLGLYRTSLVAPFTLLAPIFGMVGSMLVFHESFTPIKLSAVFLIMIGLLINLGWLDASSFSVKWRQRRHETVGHK